MKPYERYQRPNNYSLTIGLYVNAGDAVCLAPGRTRTPVKSLLVQADLLNTGVINVGNSQTSLLVGVQLDPGRAWVFSVDTEALAGSLLPTPTNWADAVSAETARSRGVEGDKELRLVLDVADFFAASDTAAQILRIFYFSVTGK